MSKDLINLDDSIIKDRMDSIPDGYIFAEDFSALVSPQKLNNIKCGEKYIIINPQIVFVTSGSAICRINGNNAQIEKGFFIIYPPQTILEIIKLNDNFKVTGFELKFDDIEKFGSLFNVKIYDRLSDIVQNDLLQYFNLIEKMAKYDSVNFSATKHLILALIHIIDINDRKNLLKEDINNKTIQLHRDFQSLLRNNNDFSQPIGYYALKLGVSESHLRSVVKLISKKSIGKVINEELLRRIKKMLAEHKSPKQIVDELHLLDKNDIYTFFRKNTDMTISEYISLLP